MDISDIAKKLGLSDSKHIIRKAAELRRLCDIQFDSSVIGVKFSHFLGEICKAIICLEIAASGHFDRPSAIKLSGMSEKAYNRSFNAMQNGLGVKTKLDIRELGIRFGCVRLIPFVQKGLSLYKDRFLASLPASRRTSADFTRPLKIDKLKLIELCGTSESEFSSVSTSMKDLCHDVFGISKEKKDPKDVKGNRELLDTLPGKRKLDDGGYSSDDALELSSYKRRKQKDKLAYEEWKSSVTAANKQSKAKVPSRQTKQTKLDFQKEVPETQKLEAM
ncbi:hypothetical protein AAG906_028159 [Vitis piasezkii]